MTENNRFGDGCDDHSETRTSSTFSTTLRSPPVPPGAHMSSRERKVWDYICMTLREQGLQHLTAGIAIVAVCKIFIRWINTEIQLADLEARNNGSYMIVTPNGMEQPHQLFYASNKLRQELMKCLPESCLTLPSAVMAKAKSGDLGQQDLLFDLLGEHVQQKSESYSPMSH